VLYDLHGLGISNRKAPKPGFSVTHGIGGHLMGMHLMGVYLVGGCPVGVYLMGVQLWGRNCFELKLPPKLLP
jgi:hypothetical protein